MLDPGWKSRKGWWTLIAGSTGLSTIEILKGDTTLVRSLGGLLWDREGYGAEFVKKWSSFEPKKFVQFKRFRLFIPPPTPECQLTGWKPYDDKDAG